MEAMRFALRLSSGRASVSLIAMTDPERLPDPEAALEALPRGTVLIWRTYGKRPAREELRRLAAKAHRKGVVLLIAGALPLGAQTGIMGLHLPERELRRPVTRGYVFTAHDRRPSLALTAACHSEKAIRRAAQAGADAVLISPVFPTESHPGGKTLGVLRFTALARLARQLGLTPYALGGIITPAHIRRLNGTGAAGVAGIGFLLPPDM